MQQPRKFSIIHMAFYLAALVVGGKYGWLIGYKLGGVVIAIILGIVGAVIASTLVGAVAMLFGHRP